jgi:hypothetical protein
MASLGQLVIELAANTARLQSDLGKAVGMAERGAAQMKKAFAFFGIAGGGGLIANFLVGTAKDAIKWGDDLQKAATKAGLGGKAISELAYAAKLADVDLSSLSTAIKKMQVTLSEAKEGAKGPTEALKALGLTIAEIQRLKPDAQFELLADRISKLTDPADRARAAVEIFGKAGADLLPLFEQGAEGIRKARQEAEKLGVSFSDETLKKLADADDAAKKLDSAWDAFATTLTAKVAPALTRTFNLLAGIESRSAAQIIDDQISELQRQASGSDTSYAEASELQRKIEQLQARRQVLVDSSNNLGGRGRTAQLPGFQNDDASKAAEAAKKVSDKWLAENERVNEERQRSQKDYEYDLSASLDEEFRRDGERQVERAERSDKALKEYVEANQKAINAIEEQSQKMSVPAEIFRDAFFNAFDDMVNTGKVKFDELFKYILTEFARRGIAKLFDAFFSGQGGALLGQIGGGIGGWMKGLFGGGRASGGSVQGGRSYVVGERGREIVTMGGPGYVTPNNALGGQTIMINNNIDARGASVELIKLLPGILKQSSADTEARIVYRLRKGVYG